MDFFSPCVLLLGALPIIAFFLYLRCVPWGCSCPWPGCMSKLLLHIPSSLLPSLEEKWHSWSCTFILLWQLQGKTQAGNDSYSWGCDQLVLCMVHFYTGHSPVPERVAWKVWTYSRVGIILCVQFYVYSIKPSFKAAGTPLPSPF